jgi:hypothetical protein
MLCICIVVPVLALANHGASTNGGGTEVRTEAAVGGALGPDHAGAERASRSADRIELRARNAVADEPKLLAIDDSGDVGVALNAAVDSATGDPDALPITLASDPSTTTTTRPKATTTTTRHRAAVKATTTTTRPKATTTTARPTTTTTRPRNTQTGQASWYQTYNGTCAHLTIPMGTMVTVTNLDNGQSVVCRVADRGPHVAGRIIDLDKELFDDLAPPSSGILDVRISW